MKIALAALGFKNKDIEYNKNVIINTLKEYTNKADIVLFGEAFLQGFDSLSFNYKDDINMALSLDSNIICEIRKKCKKYNIGLSFGFIELYQGNIYSSQLTIDKDENIIDIYRRVSPGWKELYATKEYKEGKDFSKFKYLDKNISIGLCGDLWYDDNIDIINSLNPSLVLWPVYVDYNYKEWNEKIKYEYLEQTNKINADVLLVNPYCLESGSDNSAKGGALFISKNKIVGEIASGREDVLLVNI